MLLKNTSHRFLVKTNRSFRRRLPLCTFITSPTPRTPGVATPLLPRPPRNTSLAGSVPYHLSYLFLHAQDPPPTWPSIFSSHLYLDIQRRSKERSALVNFCWYPEERKPLIEGNVEEVYSATFWHKSSSHNFPRRIHIPVISKSNVEEVLDQLFRGDMEGAVDNGAAPFEPYFYICTHGQRDCRCGVRGTELAQALRKELSDRGILLDRQGASRIGEVGHVGGHKNAPNLLVFPQGDWYGNLEPSDIPGLLNHWLKGHQASAVLPSSDNPNPLQWRGRMGMTKEEQTNAHFAS